MDDNVIGQAVDSYLKEKKASATTQLRASVDLAVGTNPDQEAKYIQLARESGMPLETVRNDSATAQRQVDFNKIQFDNLYSEFPKTAAYLTDINNAKIAHDQVSGLSTLESIAKTLTDPFRSMAAGIVPGSASTAYGLAEESSKLLEQLMPMGTGFKENPFSGLSKDIEGQRKNAEAFAKTIKGDQSNMGFVESGINSGFESFGQMLPGLVAAIATKKPSLALGWGAATAGSQAATKALDAGKKPTEALLYGLEDAVIEWGTEMIPMGKLISDLKVGAPIMSVIGHQLMREIPTEIAATIGQNFNEWMNLNPGKKLIDFVKEQPADIAQTILATATMAILGGGSGHIINRVVSGSADKKEEAKKSELIFGLVSQINDLSAASKVRDRDVSSFETFMQSATEEGPAENIYVDPKVLVNTLAQSGVDINEVAAQVPSIGAQLKQALATGTDLSIPISEFAAYMAGSDYSQALIPHLKTDPMGMTQAEGEEFMNTHGEKLKAEIDQVLNDSMGNDAFKQSAEVVKNQLLEQINNTGVYMPEHADKMATFHTTLHSVIAAKRGITPEQQFKEFPLVISTEKPGAQGSASSSFSQQKQKLNKDIESSGGKVIETAPVDQLIHSDKIPTLTMNDLLGMKIFPTIADRTAAASLFTGIDSSKIDIAIPLLGGPLFPLRESNSKAGVVWANRGKSVTSQKAAKLKDGANYMMVLMGDADMHKSNTTVSNAFFATLEAYVRDKRISKKNAKILTKNIRESVTKDEGVQKYMEEFPGLEDVTKLDEYLHRISFTARSRLMTLLGSKESLELGAPSMQKILDATREPSMAGHNWGDGVLLVELDQESPMVNLGEDGTTAHPDFPLGIKGRVVGKMATPVNYELLWQDYIQEAKDKKLAENTAAGSPDKPINTRRAFELAKPIVEVTQDLLDRIGDINQTSIDSARQAELAVDMAANRWSTSDDSVKDGGISPQGFIDAIANSPANAVLSDYDIKDVKDGIKDGELKLYQLGSDSQILFALKKGDPGYAQTYGVETPGIGSNEVTLTSVINNEQGARGVGGPAVVLKAIEEGVTVLDCFAVKNKKFPGGFLPDLYAQYGFEVVQTVPFNAEYYSTQKLKDALKYWKDSTPGYDEAVHGYPDLVIMKWSGTDEQRTGSTQRYIQGGIASLLSRGIGGNEQTAIDQLSTHGLGSSQEGRGADSSRATGNQGAVRAPVESRVQRLVHDIARLSDTELKNLGLKPEDRSAVRSALGLDSAVFNQGEEDDRGQIAFGQDITQTPSVITLFKDADSSTLFHEAAHYFLEVYSNLAAREDAPQTIKDDMAIILKQFGIKDLAAWNSLTTDQKRPFHEQFARSFEAFLFEGKTSNPELKSIFQDFRAWLIHVYTSMKKLNVTMNDEIRGVFDRMTATAEQITQAQENAGFAPLFTTKPDFMNDQEWIAYQQSDVDATRDAMSELETRSLRNMQWLDSAKSRLLKALQAANATKRKDMREQVTKDVLATPVYRAMQYLKRNIIDGVQQDGPHKLDIASLEEMYSGEGDRYALLDWSTLGYGKYGMLSTEGLPADYLAEKFGFGSGDELVRALVSAPKMNDVIESETNSRMMATYGDLNNPEEINKAINEAIHNEARARFVATEANALAKATGRPKVLASAARDYANQLIARLKIRNIKPGQYQASERRAAVAAEKARSSNDLRTAATEKRNQLLNGYAARAAMNAQDEVIKAVRWLRKFDSKGTRKNIDVDYLDQIDAILERFDLRESTTGKDARRRAGLAEWIAQQEGMGFSPLISDELRNETMRKPYKEMTLEEFRGMIDAVRNIDHLGRLKTKLLKIADQRAFAEVSGEVAKTIRDNADKTYEDKLESNTTLDRAQKLLESAFAWMRKMANMVRQMDGFKDGGVVWNTIMRPINEAANTEAGMREKASIALHELFKDIQKEGGIKNKVFIPEINRSISLEGRISIALNMGNDTNMRRIMEGEGWTIDQVHAILATLTESQANFVNNTWEYINTFWPEIAAKERRVTGVVPEKVQARPFVMTIAGGKQVQMVGGYYPIKYNSDRSTRSQVDNDAEIMKQGLAGMHAQAQTRRGHIQSRVESVDRPIRYDFGVIFEHVNQVVHDLSWHETLIDINRLISAKNIDSAVRTHYGAQSVNLMREMIKDIAVGDVSAKNWIESSLNYIRTGATIAGLAWNLNTAALQPLGLAQSIVRVGPKWVAKGMYTWLRDAASFNNTFAVISSKSEFMRLRAKTQLREINEMRNKIEKEDRVLGVARNAVEETFFVLIAKMQLVADIPTWLGAYEKAMAGGSDEAKSIAMADQAVIDAQGGGEIKDLAQIQRGGPMYKMWTTFYSYFSVTYNLLTDSVKETIHVGPSRLPLLAADVFMLMAVPATLQVLLYKALKGAGGDDKWDWEKIFKDIGVANLTQVLGLAPGVRELGSMIQGYGYSGPGGLRVFADMSKLVQQIKQGEADEAFFKALANTSGVLLHFPAPAVTRLVEGIKALAEGKSHNPLAPLVGLPAKQ